MEKRNVNLWKTLQKVPAGTMFVPLIIGALITTVCQGFFQFDLWTTLGNPMKDMFSSSGQMLLIGLMLFCTGTSLKISDLKEAMGRGFFLIATRLIVAYALSACFFFCFGLDGIFGISFLAFVCAVTSIIPPVTPQRAFTTAEPVNAPVSPPLIIPANVRGR